MEHSTLVHNLLLVGGSYAMEAKAPLYFPGLLGTNSVRRLVLSDAPETHTGQTRRSTRNLNPARLRNSLEKITNITSELSPAVRRMPEERYLNSSCPCRSCNTSPRGYNALVRSCEPSVSLYRMPQQENRSGRRGVRKPNTKPAGELI